MVLESYIEGIPESLTMEEVMAIREKKKGCTWRRLALDVLGNEDQMDGKWLAEDAACRITGKTKQELFDIDFDLNDEFCKENKSHYGDHFWWE